jgi:holo-[acyl-carrier protein] synthase
MEIVGVGTNIVECVRIARMIEEHGELFLQRIFTDREICWCRARKCATEHFAARWAAKEAVFKCLRTGWRRGLNWTDIEVCTDPHGQPQVHICGAAQERAEQLAISRILLTLSFCRSYATAYAIAVRDTSSPAD